jgi:uncharacterized membrane protein (DUF2068 family)
MTRTRLNIFAKGRHHNQWLVMIAAYKLLQALLFLSIGLGARHLLHKDVGDEFAALVDHLRFNPESRLVNFVLDKAELIHDPLLRRIGLLAFSYSAISAVEGIGLYLEKVWAEYMTLAITASFLPWEIFEIFRRLTLVRVGLLGANLLVFFYLLQLVADRERQRQKEKHSKLKKH